MSPILLHQAGTQDLNGGYLQHLSAHRYLYLAVTDVRVGVVLVVLHDVHVQHRSLASSCVPELRIRRVQTHFRVGRIGQLVATVGITCQPGN